LFISCFSFIVLNKYLYWFCINTYFHYIKISPVSHEGMTKQLYETAFVRIKIGGGLLDIPSSGPE
jgi:hypothetical protein